MTFKFSENPDFLQFLKFSSFSGFLRSMIFAFRMRINPRHSEARRSGKEPLISRNFHLNKLKIWIWRKSLLFPENYTGRKKNLDFFKLHFDFVPTETDRIRGNWNEKTERPSAVCSKIYLSGFSIWLILLDQDHTNVRKKGSGS